MGANYAEAVFEQYGHLDPAPFRALVRMALIVPDKHREPVYYAGRNVLAHALGCNMPHPGDESEEAARLRANAYATVKRAVRALRDAGALSTVRRGRLGVNAEYRLNLRPVGKSHYREHQGDAG